MIKLNYKRGFTLIELLVVIAIIGILSGIVLTSLGTARNKAKMASAQASMSSMRAEAELGADPSSGKYNGNLCAQSLGALGTVSTTAGDPLATLATAVKDNTGAANVLCTESPITDPLVDSWAAWVDIDPGSGITIFCVDSSGAATDIGATLLLTDTTCL